MAIAEACGWKNIAPIGKPPVFQQDGYLQMLDIPPDYPNDLNKMHEAETVLIEMGPSNLCIGSESYTQKYVRELARLVENDFCHENAPLRHCFAAIYADAPKRAEAFLKATGRWTNV